MERAVIMTDKTKNEGETFDIETLKTNFDNGDYKLPILNSANIMPERLVSFNNSTRPDVEVSWLHFFIDDYKLERVWRNPYQYVQLFKKCEGIISPDFSVYRNMPPDLQIQNIYRNRAIAIWLNSIGIKVIPNIRWGDVDTFKFCFRGVAQDCVVAVGNHGCFSKAYDKQKFKEGIYRMIDELHPSGLVLYGTLPNYLVRECQQSGIALRHFLSDFAISRRKECA